MWEDSELTVTHYTGLKLVEYSVHKCGEQQNGGYILVFQVLYYSQYGTVPVGLPTVSSLHLVGLSCSDFQVYDAWHSPAPPSSRTPVHLRYSRDTALEAD